MYKYKRKKYNSILTCNNKVPRYYPILKTVLEQLGVSATTEKIDIQIIFRALEKSDFITNIPDVILLIHNDNFFNI